MVEGGGRVHTQLMTQGLADELQLAVAPLFVGQADAPRLFGPGGYPPGRMRLVETRAVGDVVLIRYVPTAPGTGGLAAAADRHWLGVACELAALCPPSRTAFSVGAVVVAADGTELARGHSREGTTPSRTPRRRPSPRSPRGIRGWPPPRSTAVWNRAPAGPRGPRPAPGSSSTRGCAGW